MQKITRKVSNMAQAHMRNPVYRRCMLNAIDKKRADILVVLQHAGDWHLDALVGTFRTQVCGVLQICD